MTRCQKKERYTIMGEEKKYTEEEIKTIVDDIICKAKKGEKKELSLDELQHTTGGRTLTTGEVITEEVIDQYREFFKSQNVDLNMLTVLNDTMGFYPVDRNVLSQSINLYEDKHIDWWATLQKDKLHKENN